MRGRDINESGIIPQVNLGASGVNPSGIDATEMPLASVADRTRAEQVYANLVGLVSNASQTFNVTSPTSGFVPFMPFERRLTQQFLAFHAQDRWRVRPRLTASAGLRWEFHGVPRFATGAALLPVGGASGLWGVSGNGNLFAPGKLTGTATTLDFGAVSGKQPLYNKDLNNFAPSIGLAWDVRGDGRTSVRAGYSISYTPEALTLFTNVANSNRGLQVTSTNSQVTGVVNANGVVLTMPQFQVPVSQDALFTLSNSANLAAFNPNLRTAYVQQWSLGVERALPAGFVMEVRYVGNHGVKLLRGVDLNETNILENGFLDDCRRAIANLAINRAGGTVSFANLGKPGQFALPVLDSIFGGNNTTFHRNSTFISNLDSNQAGTFANSLRLNPRSYPGMATMAANLFVVNPSANAVYLLDNGSFSFYNAMQVELRRRFSKNGPFISSNYTLSKVLTDFEGSTSEVSALTTLRNPRLDKRRASYDYRHAMNLNAIYELPFGGRHRLLGNAKGIVGRLAGGWNASTMVRIIAGQPINLTSGMGTLNQRSGTTTVVLSGATVNQLQDAIGIYKTPGGVFYVNPNSPFLKATTDASGRVLRSDAVTSILQTPPPGQLGTLALNALSGPLTWNADIAMFKRTTIKERAYFELRAELFNAFNHPTFSIGALSTASTQFGMAT